MNSTLVADNGAPGRARAFVTSQLETSDLPAGVQVDKVVLIVSELVTNAVQAGATTIEIDMHVTQRNLDLVVIDDAGGWPTPTNAAPDDTAGRGLSIVQQLADSWDVAESSGGKAVRASWSEKSDQRTGTNF